jgi:TolA-binding protein
MTSDGSLLGLGGKAPAAILAFGLGTLLVALPVAAQEKEKDKAFSAPSPVAKQREIVERKVKAVDLQKKKGPTAAEKAKAEFAGKQRPAVTQFDDPMERNRALIEAKQKLIEDRRQQLLLRLQSIYERTQAQGGNPTKEAELLHRMAELQWESARHQYFLKRFDFEQEMEKHLAGQLKEKPAEPKPDYTRAMELYRKILREHPAYTRIDEVIYFLGDGLKLVGRDGDAAPYFQKLVKNHPGSKYVSDALLGLAEYFFKSDLLFAARDTYKKVVEQFPNSRVYNYALYKLAWTYYNLGGMEPASFRTSIDTFKQVVESMDREGSSEKSKIEFREQALKDLIIGFAAVKTGTQEAREYYHKRGGQPLAVAMLDRLAKFFLATDKDEEAIAIYRWFMELEPNGPKVPEWEETILDSLKKIAKQDRLEKEMESLVTLFGPKGTWVAANQSNQELVRKAQDMAENALEYLASHYHQEAQRLREGKLYEKAARYYKLFVDTFPESKKAYRARFYLAEITFLKMDQPEQAATYYADVVKAGEGEFLADAAYGRIACFSKLMQADRRRTQIGGAFKYVKLGGAEKKVFLKEPVPIWEQKFVEASDEYVRVVKKPEDAVAIMYNAAEIFFYNNHYDDAVKRYAYIVENHPTDKYALHAANNILESYNRLANWKEIEIWAKRLRANEKFSARPKRELEKFIALAIFNQANDLRAAKDHDKAASELIRLQGEFPGSELSDEALFSAASLYSEAKKHDQAIQVFQRLLQTYPRSTKAAQAAFTIGAIHEGLADFNQAAGYFERRAEMKDRKSEEARNGLFNAAFLRQAMGDLDRALSLYRTFIQRFPKHSDTQQLYFRSAAIEEKRGQWEKALGLYRKFRTSHPKSFWGVNAYLRGAMAQEKLGKRRLAAKDLDEAVRKGRHVLSDVGPGDKLILQAWIAHARFLQGEALFAEYKAYKFTSPQRRAMEKRLTEKGKMLKKVTDVYEDVLNFKSGERSACALWKIGQTYQEFSQSLMEAPIPKGLTPDEEQVYKIKLQERALPVEEKAFEAYARNLKLAAENNVFNECVQQSGEALARAKPEDFPVVKEDTVRSDHPTEALQAWPPVLEVKPPAAQAPAAPSPTATQAAGGEPHASK